MTTDAPANPPDPKRFRVTTGTLMLWVATVAVALGLLKGDVADWLSSESQVVLFVLTLVALVVGTPFLAIAAERSRNPEVTRPLSRRERQAEHFLAVGCLGLLGVAFLIFGVLAFMAATAGR